MSTAGTGRLVRLWWRSGRVGVLAWVLGLVAMMAMTAGSVAPLYDTPAKRAAYARLQDAPAFKVLSGDVAGLHTLGGVMANEFGQVSSFALPLMGVALVIRGTRGEEQSGRTHLLLAGSVGRLAPLASTLLAATAALAVTAAGCAAVMVALGADAMGSLRYGLATFLLGLVHAALAVLLAQVYSSTRGVWMASLAVVLTGFLLRGIGAVTGGPWAWLSPVGWQDAVRSFGDDARWWPLLVSLAVTLVLVGGAVGLAARSDVGDALLHSRTGPARAGALLRSPWGVALHEHRTSIVGWVVGAVVTMGAYGALTQTMVEALEDMPELQVFLGEGRLVDTVVSTFLMLLGALGSACVVQGAGSWRSAEADGLLERQLSGPRSRFTWWALHLVVVAVGGLAVVLLGGVALAASTAAVTDDPGRFGELLAAAWSQVPVVVLFLGIVTVLLGWLPEHRALAWAVFGTGLVLGWIGPGLDLPQWLLDAAPFTAVGRVPAESADRVAVTVLVALGVALMALGVIGFRRRDLPRA